MIGGGEGKEGGCTEINLSKKASVHRHPRLTGSYVFCANRLRTTFSLHCSFPPMRKMRSGNGVPRPRPAKTTVAFQAKCTAHYVAWKPEHDHQRILRCHIIVKSWYHL